MIEATASVQAQASHIERRADSTLLVHRVRACSPGNLIGWLVKHVLDRLLQMREATYRHALVELEYFQGRLEKRATGERQ